MKKLLGLMAIPALVFLTQNIFAQEEVGDDSKMVTFDLETLKNSPRNSDEDASLPKGTEIYECGKLSFVQSTKLNNPPASVNNWHVNNGEQKVMSFNAEPKIINRATLNYSGNHDDATGYYYGVSNIGCIYGVGALSDSVPYDEAKRKHGSTTFTHSKYFSKENLRICRIVIGPSGNPAIECKHGIQNPDRVLQNR